MLRKKKDLPSYNDGVISIYRPKSIKNSFGARICPETLDDMDLIVCFCFTEEAQRERDVEFAERMGFSLSRKIKVAWVRGVKIDKDCKAFVDGMLYDIEHIDISKRDAYLYLNGGEPIVDPT